MGQNRGIGHRILTLNELNVTFWAPNVCANFLQKQVRLARVGLRSDDRETDGSDFIICAVPCCCCISWTDENVEKRINMLRPTAVISRLISDERRLWWCVCWCHQQWYIIVTVTVHCCCYQVFHCCCCCCCWNSWHQWRLSTSCRAVGISWPDILRVIWENQWLHSTGHQVALFTLCRDVATCLFDHRQHEMMKWTGTAQSSLRWD